MGYMGRKERFSYKFIGQFTESLVSDQNDERHRAHAVETALRGINDAEYKIAAGIQTIESRARRIQFKLDEGFRLNDLGEFQSAPTEVDQAIVTRQAFFDMLAVLLTEDELAEVMAEAKKGKS